jgi:hypothetical protein
VTWIGPVVIAGPPLPVPVGAVLLGGKLVSTPSAEDVALGSSEVAEVSLEDDEVGVGVPGPIGLGAVSVFAGACTWLVTLANIVGVGCVWVATTTFSVAGTGMTDTVLVEGSTSGCGVCTEQKLINC